MKKHLTFICKQKISFILPVFFELLQRYCKLVMLDTLRKPGYTYQQNIVPPCRKLLYLSAGKGTTSSSIFFWRYCKDVHTYFEHFGHVWIRTPKMVISPWTKFWCFFACQKQTSSFTSSLRYYTLKNPAAWLANSLLAHKSRTRILPDMWLVVKYQ